MKVWVFLAMVLSAGQMSAVPAPSRSNPREAWLEAALYRQIKIVDLAMTKESGASLAGKLIGSANNAEQVIDVPKVFAGLAPDDAQIDTSSLVDNRESELMKWLDLSAKVPVECAMSDSRTVAANLDKFKVSEIECAAIAAMSTKFTKGSNGNASLLNAKLAEVATIKEIRSLQLFRGVTFLRQKKFPDALKVLFDLQQADARFRYLYERTQRIYSFQERGKGNVALDGP
jgi:hypothetical protein